MGARQRYESLAWGGDRLFSVDLNGNLIEWDLITLRPRLTLAPTGNALWCLDVNEANTELAVGSEEGHINIMSIENGELSYKSLFNKKTGRVLCCKFDTSGKRLITGTFSIVRIWDVAKGNTLHTLTLTDRRAVIHSLLVLRDNTIIAGDSLGYVTMWNGDNATQLESNKVLNKNVFALAINERQDRLVCSGQNPPLIRVLSKTQIKREETTYECWIKYLQREPHQHYVKTLVVIGNRVFSGGQDGILAISSINRIRHVIVKYAQFLQGSVASVAPSGNLMLLRYRHSLEMWRLGTPRTNDPTRLLVGQIKGLELDETPQKLLHFKLPRCKYITASAISPDSKWICYSTLDELHMSRLQFDPLALLSLEGGPEELKPANFIHFTKENQMFLLQSAHPQLDCFDLEDFAVKYSYSLDLSDHIKANVRHMQISPCGKHLVVATSDYVIAVWQLRDKESGKEAEHLLNLPRYEVGIAALALHANIPRLVVAYVNGRIVDYDLEEKRFVCSSGNRLMNSSLHHPHKGIILDERNPNVVMLYNAVTMCVLESYQPKHKMPMMTKKPKTTKKKQKQAIEEEQQLEDQHDAGQPLMRTYRIKFHIKRPVRTCGNFLDCLYLCSFFSLPAASAGSSAS